MDSDQSLLDAHNSREDVREAEEWKRKKDNQGWHEKAAREGHKVRIAGHLIGITAPAWEEMDLSSKEHLIADAENVAANPTITSAELNQLYKDRLIARGDTDNPDLDGVQDESKRLIEEMVLRRLKECLLSPPVA